MGKGNQGTEYAKPSTKHYKILAKVPLQKSFESEGEVVRELVANEVVEMLAGPKLEKILPAMRARVRALSDGKVGWFSVGKVASLCSPNYRCLRVGPLWKSLPEIVTMAVDTNVGTATQSEGCPDKEEEDVNSQSVPGQGSATAPEGVITEDVTMDVAAGEPALDAAEQVARNEAPGRPENMQDESRSESIVREASGANEERASIDKTVTSTSEPKPEPTPESAAAPKSAAAIALQTVADSPLELKEQCIATLVKLIGNILQHPDEPKYRKLRTSNEALRARVFSVPAAMDFLRSAGFVEDGEFLILSGSSCENDSVVVASEALQQHIAQEKSTLTAQDDTSKHNSAKGEEQAAKQEKTEDAKGQTAQPSTVGQGKEQDGQGKEQHQIETKSTASDEKVQSSADEKGEDQQQTEPKAVEKEEKVRSAKSFPLPLAVFPSSFFSLFRTSPGERATMHQSSSADEQGTAQDQHDEKMEETEKLKPVQLKSVRTWSDEVRSLAQDEILELMEGPVQDEGEMWIKVRAENDGATGWVLIRDQDGYLVQPLEYGKVD